MTVSTTKTRGPGQVLGDLIRVEFHRQYNYAEGKLVNPIAAALSGINPLGQPVKASGANYVFVQDGDEAAAIGLVAHDKLINLPGSGTNGGVSDERYLILVRGPATYCKDVLPADDVNGDALTAATIVTALAALDPPLIGVPALSPTKTQET